MSTLYFVAEQQQEPENHLSLVIAGGLIQNRNGNQATTSSEVLLSGDNTMSTCKNTRQFPDMPWNNAYFGVSLLQRKMVITCNGKECYKLSNQTWTTLAKFPQDITT